MYSQKLTTAKQVVDLFEFSDTIDYGFCTGTSRYVDKELSSRFLEGKFYNLKIHGAILQWEPEIFKTDTEGKNFTWYSKHAAVERQRVNTSGGVFIPMRYSELPRYYTNDNFGVIDYLVMQVAPMDEEGNFNFGPNASHLKAPAEQAKKIIVEVNENMPVCLGRNNNINVEEVDCIVEGDSPKIPGMKGKEITEIDLKVADLIIPEIKDGSCLQLGIGGMPNAVGTRIVQSDLKDLGVHTEMYVDAFMEMEKAGKINGRRKSTEILKQVYTFAAGSSELYNYLNMNEGLFTDKVDYVNDVRTIASNDNFVSINNAMSIDLFGQIASENMGFRHISGAGGQLDFVLGSYLSNGGKSFICLASTYNDKNGDTHSRIRPLLEPGTVITVPRPCVQWIVTEYGMFNCKGKSTWERVEGLINLAHPAFREELIDDAEKMKIWKRSNKRC